MTPAPMTPARLCAVGLAHVAVLAEIHAAAFPSGEAWNAEVFAAQLVQPAIFAVISGQAGLILARVVADEAEVLTLAVRPGSRRQGIGRGLLREAMRMAAERGAATTYLEVSARNTAALALYERAGFRRVGRRARYYPGGADALILAADLSACATGAA